MTAFAFQGRAAEPLLGALATPIADLPLPFATGLPPDVVEDAAACFVFSPLARVGVKGYAGAEVVPVLEAAPSGAEWVRHVAEVAGPGP